MPSISPPATLSRIIVSPTLTTCWSKLTSQSSMLPMLATCKSCSLYVCVCVFCCDAILGAEVSIGSSQAACRFRKDFEVEPHFRQEALVFSHLSTEVSPPNKINPTELFRELLLSMSLSRCKDVCVCVCCSSTSRTTLIFTPYVPIHKNENENPPNVSLGFRDHHILCVVRKHFLRTSNQL